MSGAAPVRRLYRLVLTDPPTRVDFVSNAEKGVRPRRPLTAKQQELWSGLSCTETLTQARARAEANPLLGAYIAVLDLPDDGRFRIERTGQRAGHYTIWGDADALLACVVAVLLVREGTLP